MADKELSKKDIKKMQEEIKQTRKFISDIEDMGGKVPDRLKKALKHLETAVNTGVDIGDAAWEASDALAEYTRDLKKACADLDDENRYVCEARIERKYQARSVNFVLSYKNPDSVTSKSIEKTIKRYTPEWMCKRWEYCAKIDDKAQKGR